MEIVLASASPRRRELLEQLGLTFTIAVPDIDEATRAGEQPAPYVQRLAVEKAHAVTATGDQLVIAADTTVDLGGRILGKPADAAEATAMLRDLSARTHRVHTGVALRLGGRTVRALRAGHQLAGLPGFGRETFEEFAARSARASNGP